MNGGACAREASLDKEGFRDRPWEKLSALIASCDAQKARGFAIRQIPLGACAEPCFSRSRKHLVERVSADTLCRS